MASFRFARDGEPYHLVVGVGVPADPGWPARSTLYPYELVLCSKAVHPTRKQLPHAVPSWVPDGSRYFITINCAARGGDDLCREGRAGALLDSISVYENTGKWFIHAMMIMPDHLHLIGTFDRAHGLQKTLSSWKSFHARTLKINWQFNYFEHRLRDESAYSKRCIT